MWTAIWMLFRTQQEMFRSVTDFLGNVTFIIIIEKLSYSYDISDFLLGIKKPNRFRLGFGYLVEAGGIEPPSVSTPPQGLHAYPALLI